MNITVFAGSAPGSRPEYIEAAKTLGKWIGENGHTLIYGDGKAGMMGAVANAALQAGGKVIGIIPEFMIERGWENRNVSEMIVTKDMSERKLKMAEMSDAFIALPGGYGTLEEIADVISWVRIGLYDAPCILYNTLGIYDKLRELYAKMDEAEFLGEEKADFILYSDDMKEIEEFIKKKVTDKQ